MIKVSIVVLVLTIIVSILLGIVIDTFIRYLKRRKVIAKAGTIIVDWRRDCMDPISFENPKNISHWHQYKKLIFDVKVIPEEVRKK